MHLFYSDKYQLFLKSHLIKYKNITWITDQVNSINESAKLVTVTTLHQKTYTSDFVFNSTPLPSTRKQHLPYFSFSWNINTPSPVFDDNSLIMFDFKHTTFNNAFLSLQPTSQTSATIQFISFVKNPTENQAQGWLKQLHKALPFK